MTADMPTTIRKIDPDAPDALTLREAASLLRAGKLVVFPTETVYGLGANALDADAVARIFEAKGRPSNNPLIVHVPNEAAAQTLCAMWPHAAHRLAAAFWPGPLTLVLPRGAAVPNIVTGGGPTVGVRCPAHPVARALLLEAGIPVAAPSANRSNRLSPTLARHVIRDLAGRVEMILDGGPAGGGVESTVLSLAGPTPRLLRPGLITPSQIEAVIGPIEQGEFTPAEPGDALPSPGLLTRHYAPRARLELDADSGELRARQLATGGEIVGWLTFTAGPSIPGIHAVQMPGDAAEYAARLFAELHALDERGVTRIVAALPPDTEEWMAVRDRLKRAAA